MADLFFPQLRTGAIAHYPIRKVGITRTVSNVFPGGNVLMYPDDALRKTIWSWQYVGLTPEERALIQDFFRTCVGPLRPFTFLDPTGNLLSASSTFSSPAWQSSSGIKIGQNQLGALPNVAALTFMNQAQTVQELAQRLTLPANYSYCFSIYVSSQTAQSVTLFRRGSNSEEAISLEVGTDWRRLSTTGNLQDHSTGFSVGIKLLPGQQLSICAAQLQAQPNLSPYRDRPQSGDLYANTHWAVGELSVRELSPNNCCIAVSVEAAS